MYRYIGVLAVTIMLFAGSANAGHGILGGVSIQSTGTIPVATNVTCATSTWSVSAPFSMNTNGVDFLTSVTALLNATPAFDAAGGHVRMLPKGQTVPLSVNPVIQTDDDPMIINPGTDKAVMISNDTDCMVAVPLIGATCNGLTFAN